jgi:GNAT superfamily N-acetyltransferase
MAELRTARAQDREEIRRIDVATWSPRVAPGPPPNGERALLDRFGAENVIVAEAGEGIGGALLDAGIERARQQGRRRLRLRVLDGNAGARRPYESRGFTVEAVLPESFLLEGDYVDDILMALDLTR